jgi:phosphoribosyl-ATP pyrophosphohydrolase/phosphoribosyl-AMP cyclohydrolase/histidinol dehydrogenase
LKWLRPLALDVYRRGQAVDSETLASAAVIVESVRAGGEDALRTNAERFGDIREGERLFHDRGSLVSAAASLSSQERELLERTADRIRSFAIQQRDALLPVTVTIPGGQAGHTIKPVSSAGCYAPGGRYPLPSSVLMTAVTARAAGVGSVWIASPRPGTITLAAAAVAGADGLLAAGGAHAVAALAFGAGPLPASDIVVGPGNRWVTAAKQLVAGHVGIDMLAGPSELVVLADGSASPEVVAADLLAQAEHDPDAVPLLVTPDSRLVEEVDAAIDAQVGSLPTAGVAAVALRSGGVILTESMDDAIDACNRLAPEHLEVLTTHPEMLLPRLENYGALFVGGRAAEVLGDYGAGPNHVLPTGGTARFTGGLSVLTFLRVRTWLRLDDSAAASALIEDAVSLARLEGLEAHARAALLRFGTRGDAASTPSPGGPSVR